MIEANAIISKTQKGKDELQNRTYHLASRLRSLLFMVENDTQASILVEKARSLGGENLLQELIDQGFVAVNGVILAKAEFNQSSPSNENIESSSDMQDDGKEFVEIKALVLNCIKVSASIWDMRSLTKLVSSAHTPEELLSSFNVVEQKITDKEYIELLSSLKIKIIALNK